LVEWTIVVIFAVFPGEFRSSFIEHSRQSCVTPETYTRAAGRILSQVRCVI
jgi:hypothetical protein